MTTSIAPRLRTPQLSPTLNGLPGEPVPAGCELISTDDLTVGDVLQHAPGTFDIVTSIAPVPSERTRQVHVLRTLPNGRTTACFFWVGEHARRVVHRVVAVDLGGS